MTKEQREKAQNDLKWKLSEVFDNSPAGLTYGEVRDSISRGLIESGLVPLGMTIARLKL